MKNLNAYKILENVVRELDALYDREDAKHLMDSDFVTGHLDDLDEIISQLRELTEYDPTPVTGKIEYAPNYNPSKRGYFKGITYSDGSYADLD